MFKETFTLMSLSQLKTGSHVCMFVRNTAEGFTHKCNLLSLTGKYVTEIK